MKNCESVGAGGGEERGALVLMDHQSASLDSFAGASAVTRKKQLRGVTNSPISVSHIQPQPLKDK
jgi:hypothetical protein